MRIMATVLLTAALSGPAGAAAAAPPAPAAPGIVVHSVTGSGCRPGTATAALSTDSTAVTVTYSDYVVAAAGSTRTVSRTCRITLRINPVPGYAPTVTSVDYRGFAELTAGSVLKLAATYKFPGADRAESATLRLTGPYADSWQATDSAAPGLVTGKCTGAHLLDLTNTLSLTSRKAGAATDFAAMDATDAVAPSTVHLSWRPCPRRK